MHLKISLMVFVLMTMLSSILLSYAEYMYFDFYVIVNKFSPSIKKIEVEQLNATNAFLKLILFIPSVSGFCPTVRVELKSIYVFNQMSEQRIFAGELWQSNIVPPSNVTFHVTTLNSDISEESWRVILYVVLINLPLAKQVPMTLSLIWHG